MIVDEVIRLCYITPQAGIDGTVWTRAGSFTRLLDWVHDCSQFALHSSGFYYGYHSVVVSYAASRCCNGCFFVVIVSLLVGTALAAVKVAFPIETFQTQQCGTQPVYGVSSICIFPYFAKRPL